MQLVFNDGRFFLSMRPKNFKLLSIGSKWKIHKDTKNVSTTSYSEAYKFKDYFDDKVKKIFSRVTLKKMNVDQDLKWVKELVLYNKLDDSQKNGVQFAISRNHSYLAFEAGVGKTATTIIADYVLRVLNKGEPSLFVVPPKLIRNWLDELKEWTPSQRVKVIRSLDDVDCSIEKRQYDVLLCADSLFTKDRIFDFKLIPEVLKTQLPYTTVAVDEAHRFINLETERTKELFVGDGGTPNGIVHNSKHVMLLSGSHMKRGPIDLYAPICALAWNLIDFMTYENYGVKYCNGFLKKIGHREVWDFTGSSREDIFHKKIYNKFIYEKTLEESRPELKGKRIERVIQFDWNGSNEIKKLEKTILKKNRVSQIIGSNKIGEIPKYRQMIAKDKVEITYDYITNAIETHDGPMVLFAVFHETIELLQKKYKKYNPRIISGKVKDDDRYKIEKLFEKGKIQLVIWQVHTAYGVNMQKKGNRCIFVESPWGPDDIDQAINRFFRRGQLKRVVADHLVLADTLDSYVLKTCIDKKTPINKIKKGYTI